MSHFGATVKSWREYRRYTVSELARVSGVQQSIISRLEGGKREGCTVENGYKLAKALGATVEQLCSGIEPKV